MAKTEDHIRQLKMLENDVSKTGEESFILGTVSIDPSEQEKVVGRFKADRDGLCRHFVGRWADFEPVRRQYLENDC